MVNIKQQSAPPHSCSEEQNAVRKSRKRWSISLLSVLIIAFLLCAFDVRLKTVKYTVTSEKITAPVRIALVTDLHSCKYGKDQEVLVSAINKQDPDIILLEGIFLMIKYPTEIPNYFQVPLQANILATM